MQSSNCVDSFQDETRGEASENRHADDSRVEEIHRNILSGNKEIYDLKLCLKLCLIKGFCSEIY